MMPHAPGVQMQPIVDSTEYRTTLTKQKTIPPRLPINACQSVLPTNVYRTRTSTPTLRMRGRGDVETTGHPRRRKCVPEVPRIKWSSMKILLLLLQLLPQLNQQQLLPWQKKMGKIKVQPRKMRV